LRRVSLYLQELRSGFFTATIVPVVLGSAIAWCRTGQFHWGLFFLAMAGGLLLHAGTNVANDFFDSRSGTDAANVEYLRPFTGGSRMIQKGLLSPKEVLWESMIAYAAALVVGAFLVVHRGYPILILGFIGLFSGYFYTGTPLVLAARGLGEAVIGLNFGVLMVLGSYYAQTGRFSLEPVMASIPVALLIMLVVFVNEFQDMRADEGARRRNWVVRLGRKRSSRVYLALVSAVYLSILVMILLGVVTPFALLTLLTVPLAARTAAITLAMHDSPEGLAPANAGTVVIHLSLGLLLSLGYCLERLLS
jgi:1,4-dihydroxy-2-naphthoate octaprenyltransferase